MCRRLAVSCLFIRIAPSLVLPALLALSPLVFSGYAQRTQAARHGALPPASQAADALAPVRLSPLYRQAERDCRAHRYAQAADALRRLSAAPGLTPDQLAFCREQRAVCLHDAGQPAPVPSPVAASHAAPAAALRPEQADCGPRALALVCASLHKPCSLTSLRSAAGTTGGGTTLAGLALAAQSVGLKARGEQVDLAALQRLSGPAIAWVGGNHYVAVLAADGDTATIHDPNLPQEEDIPTRDLLTRSGGVLPRRSRGRRIPWPTAITAPTTSRA